MSVLAWGCRIWLQKRIYLYIRIIGGSFVLYACFFSLHIQFFPSSRLLLHGRPYIYVYSVNIYILCIYMCVSIYTETATSLSSGARGRGRHKNTHIYHIYIYTHTKRGTREQIDKGVAAGKQLQCAVQPMDDLCSNMAAIIYHLSRGIY